MRRLGRKLLLLTALWPLGVLATPPEAVNSSKTILNVLGNSAGLESAPLEPEQVVANLILVAFGFVGIFLIVLILYGGYLWGNARGNEQQVERAQNLIRDALIGLVIVMLSYFITAFVVSRIGQAVFDPLFPPSI